MADPNTQFSLTRLNLRQDELDWLAIATEVSVPAEEVEVLKSLIDETEGLEHAKYSRQGIPHLLTVSVSQLNVDDAKVFVHILYSNRDLPDGPVPRNWRSNGLTQFILRYLKNEYSVARLGYRVSIVPDDTRFSNLFFPIPFTVPDELSSDRGEFDILGFAGMRHIPGDDGRERDFGFDVSLEEGGDMILDLTFRMDKERLNSSVAKAAIKHGTRCLSTLGVELKIGKTNAPDEGNSSI